MHWFWCDTLQKKHTTFVTGLCCLCRVYLWESDHSVLELFAACLFSALSSLVLLNLAWQDKCHLAACSNSGWYDLALIEALQVDWHGHGLQLIEPHEVCIQGRIAMANTNVRPFCVSWTTQCFWWYFLTQNAQCPVSFCCCLFWRTYLFGFDKLMYLGHDCTLLKPPPLGLGLEATTSRTRTRSHHHQDQN